METLTLTRKQAAERLGIDEKTLDGLERRGIIKRNKYFDRPRYSLADVMKVADPDQTKTIKEIELKREVDRLRAENQALMDTLIQLHNP